MQDANYASTLGQNAELQNRWLTIQGGVVEASNSANSNLERRIAEFHKNHAARSVARLMRNDKIDFDSVLQFRVHDRYVYSPKGIM